MPRRRRRPTSETICAIRNQTSWSPPDPLFYNADAHAHDHGGSERFHIRTGPVARRDAAGALVYRPGGAGYGARAHLRALLAGRGPRRVGRAAGNLVRV